MTETIYVAVTYDFYPDCSPVDEMNKSADDIQVGVFSTLEDAKHSIEVQYAKAQRESDGDVDEDELWKIKWIDHPDYSFQNDFGGDTVIYKTTVGAVNGGR